MRGLFIILFLFPFLVYSQPPGYIRHKGDAFFLRDEQGGIIVTESGGVLAILGGVDTASSVLPQPPDTIQSSYTNCANPGDTSALSNGVQAYWSFEETGGVTAFDSAGSYDGTLMNTPTQSETGISNLCYEFNSTSDELVDFGTSFWDVGTDDLTVSVWIKIDDLGYNSGIIGNWGTYPYWYLNIKISDNKLLFRVNFADANIDIESNIGLSTGIWYHIVIRLDRDGYATLHINNVLQTDQEDISAHSAVSLSNSNTFAVGRIGNDAGNYDMDGWIDEVLVANRLYSIEEISQLYKVGIGRFWPFGGAGGDNIRIRNVHFDPRADSVRIIVNPIGEGKSTSRTDGDLLAAFNMSDSADWNDTTMLWPYLKDTTYIIEVYSGLWPEDIWTYPPNYDTILIDSSGLAPPPDPGGYWDTIFYQAFEQHSGIAPVEYVYSLQSPDWNNHFWFDSDHRWPDGWAANPVIKDSIVIDATSGSAVMRLAFDDAIIDGYDGQGSARGGEGANLSLGSEPKEVYFSYNVMLRPGWLPSGGGKLPGMASTNYNTSAPPPRDGFKVDLAWWWPSCPCPPGFYRGLSWYASHHDMPGQYSEARDWGDFFPEGDGVQYYTDKGFYFDVTDSTWVNITMRIVVNTFTGDTPNYDGLLEGYINGYLIAQWSGLRLQNVPAQKDAGVGRIWLNHSYGGGGAPLRDEWSYWDDFIVFTYDAGVDVTRGNELSPPGRVLNLPNWPKPQPPEE